MVDPSTGRCEEFGFFLPPALVERLCILTGGSQLVACAELLPAIAARIRWQGVLRGRRVLHFIDNDSVKQSLVRGYSPCLAVCTLLKRFWREEEGCDCVTWYSRVASESNPADAPSRLRFGAFNLFRTVRVEPPRFLSELLADCQEVGQKRGT